MLVTGIIITYLRCDESLGLDELYTVDPPQNLEKSLRELYQILPLDREKHYVCWLRKKTRTRRRWHLSDKWLPGHNIVPGLECS
jgi:hypothetical protein